MIDWLLQKIPVRIRTACFLGGEIVVGKKNFLFKTLRMKRSWAKALSKASVDEKRKLCLNNLKWTA